jgi:hypothetical protein
LTSAQEEELASALLGAGMRKSRNSVRKAEIQLEKAETFMFKRSCSQPFSPSFALLVLLLCSRGDESSQLE